MRLTRLRLIGFKTFVEPTDFLIEPGLTGVVGPNGCGKSNLVEALRWVMGESSHKSLRAAEMDDVIFSGAAGRPARNTAEVMLTIDNGARTAPSAFNDADVLQVSRRIEREEGSSYRVNGREVRARDVQLLFADAATGARSPALVRQGQIAEVIAAKPQARRRILEDAAGIAGLHARRHEAELRLKAADDNLLRVEDVLGEIGQKIDSLKKQGRQAARYKSLSAQIRRADALLLAVGYAQAESQAEAAARQADLDLSAVAERTAAQAQAAVAQAVAAEALPALREAEVAAAAVLQRLTHARTELEAEARRARERLDEVERQIADLTRDAAREAASASDAGAMMLRLEEEDEGLAATAEGAKAAVAESEARLSAVEAALAAAEASFNALQADIFDLNARRAALERAAREEGERLARVEAERAGVEQTLAALDRPSGEAPSPEPMRAEAALLEAASLEAEEALAAARSALAAAREAEMTARAPLETGERTAQRLETEARTLAKLFATAAADLWPPALDQISVTKGYEIALGAALGEDLDASTNTSAPAHWAEIPGAGEDPALPGGVTALADLAVAPAALQRRLRQIGVVEAKAEGERLRDALRPGQRLVSRAGDLWRWDGYTTAAEAPSAAARRLKEKNRLGDLEQEAAAARREAQRLRRLADERLAGVRDAAARETLAVDAGRQARQALDGARTRLAAAERLAAERASRRATLQEGFARLSAAAAEARERASQARAALADLAPAEDLEVRLGAEKARVAEERGQAAEARATSHAMTLEAESRRRRREAIAGEVRLWSERAERAAGAAAELAARQERALAERQALIEAPQAAETRRRALLSEIEAAESRRSAAGDRLAEGESALAGADRAARAALEALSAAREERAGSQARLDGARQRLEEVTRAIAETLEAAPAELAGLAGLKEGAALPPAPEIEARLHQLKGERERLGAVNLLAEEELGALEEKHLGIVTERDDLVAAIKRLRQAILSLNREGRERLLAAFDTVNGHFERLFTTLFDGGTAKLTLIDAEDPLEAGLDILAHPPGKKPQILSLLSGGEQALTATALIFAVFLTNPSPVCVLDEVDAPLDDANVERYCDLLDGMARQTQTRFLVITHNPITMARMNRLFGVTMAERGVSQLVSVDLESAERFLEAV